MNVMSGIGLSPVLLIHGGGCFKNNHMKDREVL